MPRLETQPKRKKIGKVTRVQKAHKARAAVSLAAREEAELCRRLNGGDEMAFSEIYRRYVERLTRYIWSRIPDRDTVEDLVSDVFLKTWQFVKLSGRITHLTAFFYQSTKNVLKDFFRKKQQGTVPFSAIEGTKIERSLSSPKDELAEKTDNNIAMERFVLLVNALPDRQRRLILLRYIEGMKTKDIAEAVNLSHANTRVLIHRGLRTLREKNGNNILTPSR